MSAATPKTTQRKQTRGRITEKIEHGNYIRLDVNSCRTLALIDSRAGRSCVSLSFVKRLKIPVKPFPHNNPLRLSAADCHMLTSVETVDLTLTIQGLKMAQTFNVVKHLNYNVILSIDFMNDKQAYIDFGNNTISICDNLVIEHLVPTRLPTNVIRVARNCTLPPLSEAIIPTISYRSHQGHFVIDPSPDLSRKHVTLAHAVVSLSGRKTQCRLLNPTNAPVLLPKNTFLATINPTADHNIFAYQKSYHEPQRPTIDYDTQLHTLKSLGLVVDATGYSQSQKEQFVAFLYNYRDLFASDISDLPGTDVVTHKIDTGNALPIRQRPYRHSPEARKEIDRQVDHLLEHDIIAESNSSWSSPVVLVKKKNNTHRLCIDMRKVNSVTRPIFFPLPLLEDIFHL